MNYSYSNSKPRRKLRLTALQLSAIFILPLFIFALVVKVRERQETENSANKIVSTQKPNKQNNMIKTTSQGIIPNSESLDNSHSAK